MLGDQVYADDTSPAMKRLIRDRRDNRPGPTDEVVDFEEYAAALRRGLGSTRDPLAPLDPAERDDLRRPRRPRRLEHVPRLADGHAGDAVVGGADHRRPHVLLGLPAPRQPVARRARARTRRSRPSGTPRRRGASFASFAQAADREADGAKGTMWSFRRDLGRVRLLVIDSRCGRILADGRHVDGRRAGVRAGSRSRSRTATTTTSSSARPSPGCCPARLHDIESWDEAIAAGTNGRRMARFGEWLRRAVDLEHWAAFRESFDRLTGLFGRIGRGAARRSAARDHLRAVRRRPPQLRGRGDVPRRRRIEGRTRSPAPRCTTRSRG